MTIHKLSNHVKLVHEEKVYHIPFDVFYTLKIYEDTQVDQALMTRLTYESLKFEGKEKAIKALKNPKTVYEMKQLLVSYDEKIVMDILKELKQYKWIDDQSYMKWYLDVHKNHGKKYYLKIFKEKGISFDLVDTFVKDIDDSLNIEHVFNQLNRTFKGLTLEIKKQKIYQKLYTLGFESETIMPLLDKIEVLKEDELKLLDTHFNKRVSKLKGTPYEKCQLWIRYAISKGFNYQEAKMKCEEIV
jgi:SOS response regulatory protein OraA/RecX